MKRFCKSCLLVGLGLALMGLPGAWPAPTVSITSMPPFGAWPGQLSGITCNADSETYSLAVYIFVPTAGWWTKPFFDEPCTIIQPDGSWSCLVTTGGVDHTATMFAVFLIPKHICSDTSEIERIRAAGVPCLPTRIYELALDYDIKTRPDPTQRIIRFSGYEWLVKSSSAPVGPGPNYFSDSFDNVWVDQQGRLHLRITQRNGNWYCAEVVCKESFGYGLYRFYLDTPVDDLDENIVLGLFTWSDECMFGYRELDIEFSKWGDANNPSNAQYVVQPWYLPGRLHKFKMPSGVERSNHTIFWCRGSARFRSARGHAPDTQQADIIEQWDCSSDVPEPGGDQARINLWLMSGLAPANGQEREIIISKFEFVPTIPAAKLSADNTNICLENALVTATFPEFFYVESDDRACGIRVEKSQHGLVPGVRVNVEGMVLTNSDMERFVAAQSVVQLCSAFAKPVAMVSRSAGGTDWHWDATTGAGQAGVKGGFGLSNIGLLISIWGRVTQIGPGYFYIDDGSNLRDGTFSGTQPNIGIRVISDSSYYSPGDYVVVTGVSSCFKSPFGDIVPRVLSCSVRRIALL